MISCKENVIKPLKFSLLNNIDIKKNKVFYKDKEVVQYDRFYLNQGSFGFTNKIIFKVHNRIISIVEKISYINKLDELKIVKKLNNLKCDLVPYKLTSNKTLIMFSATGTLYDFRGKLKKKQIEEVIISLKKIIDCFRKYKLNYIDFKLTNILYECRDNNINILLGDLGSFVPYSDMKTYPATYLPNETSEVGLKKKDIDDKTYSFYLGIIYLELLDIIPILKMNGENLPYRFNLVYLYHWDKYNYIKHIVSQQYKYSKYWFSYNRERDINLEVKFILNTLQQHVDKLKKKHPILNTLNDYETRPLINDYLT